MWQLLRGAGMVAEDASEGGDSLALFLSLESPLTSSLLIGSKSCKQKESL